MIYKIPQGRDGILCALFESFCSKEKPTLVTSGSFQTIFGETIKEIEYSDYTATRVRDGLLKIGGTTLVSRIFYALRSNDEKKENLCFSVASKCLKQRKNILEDYADEDVLTHFDLCRKISYETHRMTGFLRFQECSGNFYAAVFAPDNDILDLVSVHFQKRFKGYPFLIADEKRKKILFYNGQNVTIKKVEENVLLFTTDSEAQYVSLWQKYFSSVSIKERKNQRLQDGWLPRRYRKNMSEFTPPKTFN